MTVIGGEIKPRVTSGLAWKGGGRGWGLGEEGLHGSGQAMCCVFLKLTFFGCAVSLREDKSQQKRRIDR